MEIDKDGALVTAGAEDRYTQEVTPSPRSHRDGRSGVADGGNPWKAIGTGGSLT